MKRLKYAALSVFNVLVLQVVFVAQEVTFYRFDKDFISANYSNSAIGSLPVKKAHRAQNIHSVSCGGKDGELHVGMKLDEVNLVASQMPLSDSPGADDEDWGVVAELPNAKGGNGPAQLNLLNEKPVTFHGFFRVWDEGHSVGAVFPSNPHHVFEVHPAWGFEGDNVNFNRADLVDSIEGYRGFGATKFKTSS